MAGTTMRRSTTGRTRARWDVATWRSGAASRGARAGGRWSSDAAPAACCCRLAKAGISIVGIDRSEPMLAYARKRLRRLRTAVSASIVRGDIRQLPFPTPAASASGATSSTSTSPSSPPASASSLRPSRRAKPTGTDGFNLVIAPYGILQSLVRDRDLTETLRAVSRVLAPGGVFGLDLVPDVPRWREYSRRVSMRASRGPRGIPVSLIESVRQDRERGLTIFDQEFVEGSGRTRRTHRFSLTFRTVGIQSLRRRLERAGFRIDAVLGSYDGAPWDPRADVWVILASKV